MAGRNFGDSMKRFLLFLFRKQPKPVDTAITLVGAVAGQGIILAAILHMQYSAGSMQPSDFQHPAPFFGQAIVMLLGFVVSTSFTVGATVKQACTDEEGKYLYPRLHRGNGWWLLGVWTVLLLEALPFLGVIP